MIHIFFSALITIGAWGDEHPVCKDLFKRACAPGSRQDGTGRVLSATEMRDKVVAIEGKFSGDVKKDVKKFIQDPSRKDLINRILSAANVDLDTCESEPKVCQDSAENWLYEYTRDQLFGGHDISDRPASRKPVPLIALDMDDDFQKLTDNYKSKIQDELTDKKLQKKVGEDIFPKLKQLMIERLEKADLPKGVRSRMITRVKALKYSNKNCHQEMTSWHLLPNAFQMKNEVRLCTSVLAMNTSEFAIASLLGHELAHVIDPCNMVDPHGGILNDITPASYLEVDNIFPLKGVLSCLRKDSSIWARTMDQLEDPNEADQVRGSAEGNDPDNTGKDRPPNFSQDACREGDQISEALCDYLSAEILTKYISQNHQLTTQQYRDGFANAGATGCVGDIKGSPKYASFERRVNGILLAHPEVREKMGCKQEHSKYKYCPEGGQAQVVSESVKGEGKPPARRPMPTRGPRLPWPPEDAEGVR